MLRKISLLCFSTFSLLVNAQEYVCHPYDPDAVPREHPFDITNMKVEVSFEPEKALVKGKVTHSFKVIRPEVGEAFFDGPGIKILKATLDGKEVTYKTDEKGITVNFSPALKWDGEHQLTFQYEATPRKGIYFIGWNLPDQSDNKNPYHVRRQVWTQGQGIDHRNWIPMYDDANDKFITETIITFDKKYKVLSNGTLRAERANTDGTKTWHYSMTKPHAGYLLMLAIGDYAVMKGKTRKGTPLNLYYYPDMADRAEPTYRYTSEMFDVLESETGIKYPWESYSQVMVQDYIYGAMENTTATIFGDFFNCDKRQFLDRNYVGVNCHELTHQWFGDYITHRSYADIWLQESYATHFPKVFSRVMWGVEEYQWQEYNEMKRALEAGAKDNYPVRSTKAGSARYYPKGSVVIAMLKRVVGEQAFNRALNHYMTTHAYANVETNDLYQAIQDKLGLAPYWFFDQWLYRGGEPHFEVRYETTGANNLRVHVKQIHKTNETVKFFRMPVQITAYLKNGNKATLKAELAAVEQQSFNLNVDGEVSFVIFDEGNTILKNVTFNRSKEELLAQAEKAVQYIDRVIAVEALKATPAEEKIEVFSRIFYKERHHAIKMEILSQLSNSEKATEIFVNAFEDKNVEVRRAAITSSWKNNMLIASLEKTLEDSSYRACELALDKLMLYNPSKAEAYLAKTENLLGEGNANRVKWLEHAISLGSNTRYAGMKAAYTTELEGYTSNIYEFHTRQNAFDAIKRLNLFNAVVFRNLLQAASSWNGRLAAPANSTLEYFLQQSQNRRIASENLQTSPATEKSEQEAIKKLGL